MLLQVINMVIKTKTLKIKSKGENDIIDITQQTQNAVDESYLKDGVITIFVSGSTGALTTIEYEPGLVVDFPNMLDRIAPKDVEYAHEKMWHDGNGHSHVRASLIGPSLTIPFKDKKLLLGTWQQIVFLELDTRSRNRNLVLQIVGE
jgi:secondary thiamine-phosphate synthase enzyme